MNKRHSQPSKKNTKIQNRQITWRIVTPNVCGYISLILCLVILVVLFLMAAGPIIPTCTLTINWLHYDFCIIFWACVCFAIILKKNVFNIYSWPIIPILRNVKSMPLVQTISNQFT